MTPPPPDTRPPLWCEVSRGALRSNVEVFRRRLSPGARLGVVVKADAYGHGLALCARAFLAAGADWLIVNSALEAVALRAVAPAASIYICGPVFPEQADLVVAADARVVVYDPELVTALAASGRAAGRAVPVHVKVETGNHRQGLAPREALTLGLLVDALDGVRLEGLATHYADIEDTTDHGFARGQLDDFRRAAAAFRDAGLALPMVHCANSAATILWPETHCDLARVGIAAYGLWPSRETFATALQVHAQALAAGAQGPGHFVPELVPALSWRTRIAQLKTVPAGAYVGYGRTFRTTSATRIAVLPVGYHEGYDRRLSNLAHVLVGGVRAPIRGRVCMNMAMIDASDAPAARRGAVVTLLGAEGDERVTAEHLAGWMGTINYEVVSRIHPQVPRLEVA